jgi:hypothetical protein
MTVIFVSTTKNKNSADKLKIWTNENLEKMINDPK